MNKPKICLCLTRSTLTENAAVLDKYRSLIDMAELRADYLNDDERLHIRRFPEMAGLPVILTIRRTIDGGRFREGEASRTTLMARGIAFASQDKHKNFAYIDLEEDFDVPSIQEAALAFGTRIIRSFHDMNNTVGDIAAKMASLRKTLYEIPKISCMPQRLSDVTRMFKESQTLNFEHIICAMGSLGLPSRILAERTGSFLTYCAPEDSALISGKLGQIDPIQLNSLYNFHAINADTKIFGITGWPLAFTSSPKLHNEAYRKKRMNAVFIPVKSETIEDALEFAETLGMKGLSVTVPHKESVMKLLTERSSEADACRACNTVVRTQNGWGGYNTDTFGFEKAVLEFLGVKTLKQLKVAIIGAGGAAQAVANVIYKLGAKACVFNRSIAKARTLAEKYRFKYGFLGFSEQKLLESYSDLIVQATSVGMSGTQNTAVNGVCTPDVQRAGFVNGEKDDPLDFFGFSGRECVFDLIYNPEKTPLLSRAEKAGCKICNGYTMLVYQAQKQFELLTGEKYE